MGHIRNVDHFEMSQPTFPPHPHAGFSAVTYMLPWSAGAFLNRDSLGDKSRIAPGDLHWTLAARGMMHEEIPETPGTVCEGLQIFVKLAEADEFAEPRAIHVSRAEMPATKTDWGEARVLTGSYLGAKNLLPLQDHTTMAHLTINGSMRLAAVPNRDTFVLVMRGAGEANGSAIKAGSVLEITEQEIQLSGDNLEFFFGASELMKKAPVFAGPFCMFEQKRLTDARGRFAAGDMGNLI